MPSQTIYPASAPVSRPISVTVTGSGTSWTGATTFNVTGGTSPTISGLSVSGQVATFTLNPGPSTGTLTIGNSTDAATCTVTVATTVTVAGTNLTADNTHAGYFFDPGNEFTEDSVGRTFDVSGGTGLVAGTYTINSVLMRTSLSGQGTHNIAQILPLVAGGTALAAGAASGGSWSYVMRGGGSGFAGSNLTPWSYHNQFYFDPDAPANTAGLNGRTIAVSGTGFAAGTYTVSSVNASFPTGSQGVQNLLTLAPVGGNEPVGVGLATQGGVWAVAGGDPVPTPTVNPSFTGAINILEVGDSITSLQGSTTASALATQYPNASSITVTDSGVGSTKTAQWLPGQSAYNAAVAAANSAGATVATVMLGTNDSQTSGRVATATYQANLQSIVDGLVADIPTLRKVVLQEQPYVVPGTNGSWDATSNTRLGEYYATYSAITGSKVVVGAQGMFAFFQSNPQDLGDGVHPNTAGQGAVNYFWLTSMASSITAAGLSAPSHFNRLFRSPVLGSRLVIAR